MDSILRDEHIRSKWWLSYDSALKHLGVLQWAGLVTRGRGKVFEMHREHLPVPGERVVDFGHCVLRLEEAR